ncbi:hypothetical protein FEZ48_10350 [Marinilactibacillus psychrotolerans]|uniref:Protein CR006 P-loop domain-containing protein n=1 Tax=Marinilactibacillus psychrotolerans TaxID=191770 RepID=A0A5R9C0V2_9LACT|nr:AAA family ATPase [Marinilactibacillus psychrotolerans]TLQ06286.1 hypothetical protein FEZ48_10350 [Marinilactibacillus psychrotolerans]
MTNSIDLSNYEYIFSSTEIKNLKKKNFIFGKNGTGKSTLCEVIKKKKGEKFDVRLFQGFESVLSENKKLNSIVLGEENKQIQEKVDEKKANIKDYIIKKVNIESILNSLNGIEEVEKDQILLNYEKAKKDFLKKENEIGLFYKKSAGELTIQFNLGRTYNRNNFRTDIFNSKKLLEEEKAKLEKMLNENEKQIIFEPTLPIINLEDYLKSTKSILQTKVEAKVIVPELENDPEKQSFAKTGLELHHENDHCAFCGKEVTSNRITKLKSFFEADEILDFQNRIKKGITKISSVISEIEKIELLKQKQFYSQFSVKDVNQCIDDKKREYIDFLKSCKVKLEEKEKNLFDDNYNLKLEVPESFIHIQTNINDLIKKSNEFTKNIDLNKKTAKENLILHYVAEKCEEGKLEKLQGEIEILKTARHNAKKILDNEIDKISNGKKEIEKQITLENSEIKRLQTKIKNPEIIIQKINEKLLKSGKTNLKLKYIETEKHYQILNSDGTTREITEISTGEKNIIAFLYFKESLDSPELNTGKPKIIIFDDPMNSNDDTMQYLIISELEYLYNRKDLYEHFVLLTHNSHFYLKVTHSRRVRRDGKNAYEIDNFIRLNSDGELTNIIHLKNKKEDFVTQYGSLWKELKFLYEHDKKDFMCNTIRRIIETYVVFNGISGNKNAESKMLFNTNSHYSEVGDLETDTNGYSREQIMGLLRQYFQDNNAIKHYNNYWKE